jgi:serine phosphatase RsbU (regulator of sigma subunit)
MKLSFTVVRLHSTVVQAVIVALALILTIAITTYLSFVSLEAQLMESLQAQAAMIADNIAPAVQFLDKQTADDILRSLASNRDVFAVLLLDGQQHPFAFWSATEKTLVEVNQSLFITPDFDKGHYIYQPILIGNLAKGMLVIEYGLNSLYERIAFFAAGTLIAILLMLTTAFFLLKRIAIVQRKKQEIETVHRHTKDSIEYASLIQQALMPDTQVFAQFFREHAIFWQPKDVVGGDIYSFMQLRDENEALLMVIDCTGHGVPGAFVTMLVKAIEQQIVTSILHRDDPVSPADILAIFNATLKRLLKQETESNLYNAGFDGAVVYYNRNEKYIKFASANTPLFYMQAGRLTMLKGDRHSIGYHRSKADYVFSEATIRVDEPTSFYITTDGFLDQSGGQEGFMFGRSRFMQLITELEALPMSVHAQKLQDALSAYQGQEVQNDDVTVVCFRL